MRKFIIGLALASTAAMAAPAAAQYQDTYRDRGYENRGYGYGQQSRQFDQRIYQLRERVQRVSERGAVSRNDAYRLQREIDQIERRYNQYARNGINRQEGYDLQQRIQNLQGHIREDRQQARRHFDVNRGYRDDDRRYDDRRSDDDRYYDRRRDRDDD